MCTAGIEEDVVLHRHWIEDYKPLCTFVTGTALSHLFHQRSPSPGLR
jgi:hypothetical protein